ncbi:hypothetical protein Pcinc_017807 [Petrolisthes cinctipes]|uniref:RNA-directed DNA polymerase n=1 Tax=Petrolisthes cinctipes TaxID=88211 RepID=A0AAE1FPJ7_PETCI|nr:hypothetical protein Pcinc_017807 [Petrolisthes cinctipes]
MVHVTTRRHHTGHQVVPPEHVDNLMSHIPNYVEICLQRKAVQALVDSGSDYSLVSENALNARQRQCIVPCHATAHSVSNELLPVVGQVFLVTSVNLLSTLSAAVNKCGRAKGTTEAAIVKLKHAVTLPPRTEAMVNCIVSGLIPSESYLVEPLRPEGATVVPARCCITGTEDGCVYVRVVNTADTQETLHKGEVLGKMEPGIRVSRVQPGLLAACCERDPLAQVTIGNELTNQQKESLLTTLQEFQTVFYTGGPLPLVRVGVEHTVWLDPQASPLASRPRRLSPLAEAEVRGEIKKLQEMNVIRKSCSPWAAPIVCGRRQDGSLRLAIDYRGVNKVSSPATLHPLPVIEDLLDRLGTARYFSILDAKSGYHQMPMDEEDSAVSAFVVPWGHYEWAGRTPFGLKGAGYSFQRMMSTILGECDYIDALCYLDNVLIWGETFTEHNDRLRKVLTKIRAAGLKLAPRKCRFGVRRVEYLGAVVGDGMLSMGEQRVKDLRTVPTPTTVRELRRMLGGFSYVQRWLPGLAETAKPLYDALNKNPYQRLKWTEEMRHAFQTLKLQVATATSLNLPDYKKRFVLVTDASNVGTGAMLANRADNGNLLPIAFFHHTLTPAEQRYSVTEKELLAVIVAIKRFRIYLCSSQFDLVTDHRALRWLNSLDISEERGRRGRWIDFLQQFDVNPIHKAGRSPAMSMADYLSRVVADEVEGEFATSAVTGAPRLALTFWDTAKLMEAQQEDEEVKSVMESLMGIEDETAATSTLKPFYQRLRLSNQGILCYVTRKGRRTEAFPHGTKESLVPVIPASLRAQALLLVHDAPLSGHMGQKRTWERARGSFWWPEMKKDVEAHISKCEACGINKRTKTPGKAPLQSTEIPDYMNGTVQIDFIGPFPSSSKHRFRYILQMQDILTRYIIMVPTPDATSETASRILVDRWVCLFGLPRTLSSDRGSHFTSELFQAVCREACIQQQLGSPYHPRSQAQVERQNQLVDNLRCMCQNNVDEWPELVPHLQFNHNTSRNATVGQSPHELVFGLPARRPEQVMTREISTTDPDFTFPDLSNAAIAQKLVREKTQKIQRALHVVRERVALAQGRRNEKYRSRGEAFQVGESVRLKLSTAERRSKGGKKMSPFLSRRYRVVKVLRGGWSYQVIPEDEPTALVKVRHYDELQRAPTTAYSWEAPNEVTQPHPSDASNDRQPVRCRRCRRPPGQLQVDPCRPTYEYEREEHWDDTDDDSSEDVDFD